MKLESVCVFCGSSMGNSPVYAEMGEKLGETIAKKDLRLVYGGGTNGMMGIMAKGALDAGGKVTGVIPDGLVDKVSHDERVTTFVEKDMHARKAKMYQISDGFIAFPGGIGTLEELAEALTWSQLGFLEKPVILLNINHYYDKFIDFVDHMVKEGFFSTFHREKLICVNTIEEALEGLVSFKYEYKWKLDK